MQPPRFLTSANRAEQFPLDAGREIAFGGRSNSGKSSAINALLAMRRIARTSKTPGRTQLINFFEIAAGRRFVDLPGYGYARVPAAMRAHWRALLEAYFEQRRSLVGLIVTMDIRREPNEQDGYLLEWAAASGLHSAVLLTKADKLGRGATARRRQLVARCVPGSEVLPFSSVDGTGVDAGRRRVAEWLELPAG